MQTLTTGNERFYQEVVSAEVSAQEVHNALYATHAEAFDKFFNIASEFGEPYARENFPDLANAVDQIYASLGHIQEMRSSPARREALIESLVAELKEIGAKADTKSDPIVTLRSDLMELSSFRSEHLDGVKIDFWLVNAQRQVSLLDKKGFSAPAITAWCKVRGIKPKLLDDALGMIAPLWDKHPYKSHEVIAAVSSALDSYPFDAVALLENARTWPEANSELIEGVVSTREMPSSMSPGR